MTRKETMNHIFDNIPIGNNLRKERTQYLILIGTTTELSTADVPNIYVDVGKDYLTMGLSFNSMGSMDNLRHICRYEATNLERLFKTIPEPYKTIINQKCGNGPGPKYNPFTQPLEPSTVTPQFIMDNVKRNDNTTVNGKTYKWVYPCVDIATRPIATPEDLFNEMPVLITLLRKATTLQKLCFVRIKYSVILGQIKINHGPLNNLKRMEQSYSKEIQELEKLF